MKKGARHAIDSQVQRLHASRAARGDRHHRPARRLRCAALFLASGKSEIQVAKAQIESLEKALDQFRLDAKRYPTAEEGLAVLVAKPANVPGWSGPYLKKAVPNDPWGRPYLYRMPGEKHEFEIVSYGRDGKAGGTGEDADIRIQ